MGTTNALQLPFPELTEMADGPDAISDLANAVEDYFYDRILPPGVVRTPGYHWGEGVTPPASSTAGLRRGDTYYHTGQAALLYWDNTIWRIPGIPGTGSEASGRYAGQYRDSARGLERWDGTGWGHPTVLPYCQAVQNTAQSIPHGGWHVVNLQGETHDSDNMHAANSTRVTAPVKGIYRVSGIVSFAAAGTISRHGARVTYNNTVIPQGVSVVYAHNGLEYTAATPPMLVTMNATDYVELQCGQASGSALNTGVFSDQKSFLTVECVRQLP